LAFDWQKGKAMGKIPAPSTSRSDKRETKAEATNCRCFVCPKRRKLKNEKLA